MFTNRMVVAEMGNLGNLGLNFEWGSELLF